MKGLSVIYEPRGRAREYGELACNLYGGCGHGCAYCFVKDIRHMDAETWRNTEAVPAKDVLRKLERDLMKLAPARPDAHIFLCFMTDPYHPGKTDITREALQLIGQAGLKAVILTKGGARAQRDFDVMARYWHSLGATVTLLYGNERQWEPGAPPALDRLECLGRAKHDGIRTWVSLEPVIDPWAALEVVDRWWQHVDFFRVGKLNHYPEFEAGIDWLNFKIAMVGALERHGYQHVTAEEAAAAQIVVGKFYLKRDLVKAAAAEQAR